MPHRKMIENLQDLSSFDYKKVESSRGDQSNVGNLPTPPSRVTEVETKLISANFSKLEQMDRGSNEVKGDSFYGFDEGFGNIALMAYKTVEDFKRFAKWQLTPQGLIFNIKQYILQRKNARRETRIYNPIGLFASLTPFIHAPRHRGGPGAYDKLKWPPKYPDDVMERPFNLFPPWSDGKDMEIERTTRRDLKSSSGPGRTMINSEIPKWRGYKSYRTAVRGDRFGLGRSAIYTYGKKLYSVGVSNQLQVPHHGTKDNQTTSDLPKDFIKFRIRDLVNSKWLIFPAHLGAITDTVSPSWTSEKYIGRPDSVHIYTGTDRSVGFDFKVAAFTKQEIPIIQEKMNYLVGLGYPTYKSLFDGDSESRPIAPYISLTIGDLFNNTPGFFSSITLTIEENATWELDDKFQIPQVFNVSVEFTYIGKYLPQTLGKHYEVPWLYDLGTGEGVRGTYQAGYESQSPVENTMRPTGIDKAFVKEYGGSAYFGDQIDTEAMKINE